MPPWGLGRSGRSRNLGQWVKKTELYLATRRCAGDALRLGKHGVGDRSPAVGCGKKKLAKPYLYPTKASTRGEQMNAALEEVISRLKPGNPPRRISWSVPVRFCQFFLAQFRLRRSRDLVAERKRCPGSMATGASLRLCPSHRECLILDRVKSSPDYSWSGEELAHCAVAEFARILA